MFSKYGLACVTIGRRSGITQTKTEQKRINFRFFWKLFFNPDSLENIGRITEKFPVIYLSMTGSG
jgi:hypothetical protein